MQFRVSIGGLIAPVLRGGDFDWCVGCHVGDGHARANDDAAARVAHHPRICASKLAWPNASSGTKHSPSGGCEIGNYERWSPDGKNHSDITDCATQTELQAGGLLEDRPILV